MSPAVKICGVCSPADGALVAELGADYIGVILAPGRARSRSAVEAAAIYDAASGVRRVGVFVDARPDDVRQLAERLRLDIVQLHGAEPAEDVAACRDSGRAVWKAVAVRAAADVEHALALYDGSAHALLLDGATGGGGVAFGWSEIALLRQRWPASLQLVAAGGLHADNVADAVAVLRPDVVDVSSGVEAGPGIKSAWRLRRFITAVRPAAAGRVAR